VVRRVTGSSRVLLACVTALSLSCVDSSLEVEPEATERDESSGDADDLQQGFEGRPSDVEISEQDDAPEANDDEVTEPVPAPSGGGIDDVVETDAVEVGTEVSVGEQARSESGLTVVVTAIRDIEVEASAIGELGGAAVEVRLEVRNTGDSDLALSSITVAVEGDDGAPLSPIASAPQVAPFREVLPSGGTSSATYVFSDRASSSGGRRVLVHAAGESTAIAVDEGEEAA
jgi:hypothetical protein